MLTSVLGVLLAASLGSGPNAVRPEDTCLMEHRCDRVPVYCLVEKGRCDPSLDGDVCFVDGCRDLRLLEP